MALFRQLAGDQGIQTRLCEELNEAFDSDIDVEDMDAYTLGKLPFLDAVVQETLRLIPPAHTVSCQSECKSNELIQSL